MTMLTSITVMLSAILIMIMVPRIYSNWLQLKDYLEQGDREKLIELQTLHNQWVIRHFGMGLLALGFVTAMKHLPGLEMHSQAAAATAAYSVISLTLALVESFLAQKTAAYAAAVPQSAQKSRREQRSY